MDKFQVIEDNVGCIALFVFDNDGNIKYAHTGYEDDGDQLLTDLNILKKGDCPVSEWDGDFGSENHIWESDQDLYDDLSDSSEVICDNDGIYYSRMGDEGWKVFKDSTEAVAAMIHTSETWIDELNYELCKYAGIEEEFEKADAESFESVVYKAADILGVII